MFKRANKVTALLVAAASIMATVPAMAADSTTGSRLGSKDGHITNAVAYKDGKYAYQGYKTDDDTDSVYYNAGDKDKELSDISDATLNTTYDNKYAFANDGSDQYLIDLTSGSVTDDSTPSDDADTAATKLQTKLKKADRYGDSVLSGQGTSFTAKDTFNGGSAIGDDQVVTIPGGKFGDNWYAYDVTTNASDADKYVTNGRHLYGFADGNGKYIDASYTANIYAYSTEEGKMVKVENFSNSWDDVDSDSKLLATLVKQPVALTQDKDNIYALVTVAITDTSANAVVTGGTSTQAATYVTSDSNKAVAAKTTVRTYIQKISKTQGDQKDDAYLPKTVESYEVGNAGNDEYDCGDAQDAFDAIGTVTGKTDLTSITQADVVETTPNGEVKPLFSVNNGDLVLVNATTSKVKGITLKFKKDKVKYKTFPGYKKYASTTTQGAGTDEKSKFDQYLLEKDSDDSVDIDNNSDVQGAYSYDFDVDGNLWVIADGKIYQYKDGGDMTKVYTTDSALDAISVYDSNNMFLWEVNGDIYTTVNEGKAQNAADSGASTTTTQAATTKSGWDKLADGSWNFYDATGTKVVNSWQNVGGVWYFLKADGTMATGWQQVGGAWYFLASSGAMQTGWVVDGGTWYYLAPSGAMKTGWVLDNGTWYYLQSNGAMAHDTTVDGYVLGSNGAML